jgi:D-alanine-D-alanine ligase-like ATP-grasp enzyme
MSPPSSEETTSDNNSSTNGCASASVHVFLPFALRTAITDPENYYNEVLEDGTQACSEWDPPAQTKLKTRLDKLSWIKEVLFHKLTLYNAKEVLATIDNGPNVVILNLTDGQESDGWPGISVLRHIETSGIAFTGATSDFFSLDTSKTSIKKHLLETGATPGFFDLTVEPGDVAQAIAEINKLKMPIIVKPCPSSGSRGITGKSVVWNAEEALEIARKVRQEFGGCYVEEFIAGREFSALVSGDEIIGIRTYPVMERVFSKDVDFINNSYLMT